MSDRLAVFNGGRIEQVGAPAEVYERPASRFVAGFVGTSNLLSGDVAERIVGRGGTFTIRPEKIHTGRGRTRASDRTRPRRSGTIREVVYLGPDTRYIVTLDAGRGTRRHAAEPGDVLDRGARPAGQGCPPRVEAAAPAPRRGRGRDSWRRSGVDANPRRILALLAGAALVAGACSSGASVAVTAPSAGGIERRAERGRVSVAPSAAASVGSERGRHRSRRRRAQPRRLAVLRRRWHRRRAGAGAPTGSRRSSRRPAARSTRRSTAARPTASP